MLAQPEFKRFPAVRRALATVNVESDVRVRILGKVADRTSEGFIIDDGESQAELRMDNPQSAPEPGLLVTAFCRVLPLERGFELHCELVQIMHDLDMHLYKKVFGKEQKSRV